MPTACSGTRISTPRHSAVARRATKSARRAAASATGIHQSHERRNVHSTAEQSAMALLRAATAPTRPPSNPAHAPQNEKTTATSTQGRSPSTTRVDTAPWPDAASTRSWLVMGNRMTAQRKSKTGTSHTATPHDAVHWKRGGGGGGCACSCLPTCIS